MSVVEHYDEIPHGARVVFDWDNTLKIVNKDTKTIECSVPDSFLSTLITEKACRLYIISAIRPSKMNMETLLMEVDRLGIREFFCPFQQLQGQHAFSFADRDKKEQPRVQGAAIKQVQGGPYSYVRWGNITICGYDKAEVFLQICREEESMRAKYEELSEMKNQCAVGNSRFDCEVMLGDSLDTSVGESDLDTPFDMPVVFFDDEEVNILNFSKIVKNSRCIWIH